MERTQWLPILLLSSLFAGVSACKSEMEKGVVGKWEAAQLKECDDIVPIQTALVGLELFPDGRYTFNSTLNVREEGTFRIKKNYLYRLDKKAKNATEKAVFIQSLTADTMVLAMNFKGKDQWLTLVREGSDERQANREMAAEAEQMKKDSLAMAAEMKPEVASKTVQDTPSVNSANLAATSTVVKAAAAVPVAVSNTETEPKAEPKKEESKPLTANEAYQKREAKRKAEEAERKKERDAYLKREAKRREEAADRERDRERERKKEREAYLKREAKRKKEEAERKQKRKK